MPHNLKALLPPQKKSKKRKWRSSKTDESDCFINCVKTYRQKLNEEILSQKQFISNGGLENLGGNSLCEMIRFSLFSCHVRPLDQQQEQSIDNQSDRLITMIINMLS